MGMQIEMQVLILAIVIVIVISTCYRIVICRGKEAYVTFPFFLLLFFLIDIS